ncbi:uncharacterized protein EMH_0035700 [Eimeria mitis]|uniref:Transmembrane protein n=1 Tax=Eimeria mitis TaxID=44415 RepID=U6JWJ2_9EIME|nr:uncharacterized protein EMH_0035700 [Eimeria mitis]CDJ27873.1 hypothetical protein, conserved [Eimeria mitis]
MKLPGFSVPCAEPASFVSELSSASDTHNICLANFEARWLTIADAAKGALHRVLSDCIRRLYIEVHNAASVYGYFDCDRAVKPQRYPPGRQKFSEKPQPREETTETTAASAEHVGRHSSVRPGVVGSFAPQPVGPWGLLCSKVSWLPRFTWLKSASGISSAVAAGAVTVLLSRSSCAQFVIAAPAMFAFAVVASCVIVWGQLELSVRRSSKRIRQLLTDMNLQHKLAGEILRWIQELEVTFKAFPGAFAKKGQRAADAPPSASPCRDSGGQTPYDTSGQLQEVSVIGPPHCQGLPCCQNEGKGEQEWGQLRPNGLRSNVPCAWHLRIRLCQVSAAAANALRTILEEDWASCPALLPQPRWSEWVRTREVPQVSAAAANALRTILEEDWASCPVLLPQPRWSEWVRTREVLCRPTDTVAESLKLTHWAVSPPATASQYSGTLCRASSYKHRSALASMSRNVAASLALLRLPAQSSCSHLKCPENDMSVQGRPGTACRPGQHSVDSGSTVCLTPMNQHTSPEKRQEEGDAHLRSALASMSRNVAASLALLRLPAQTSCYHLKCPENDMSVQGRPDTACRPGQHSVDSGSTVCLTPMNQHTSPEERQEEGDAHLFGFLHLILRHLRVASEEGEKLEKSLRLNREKLEGFKTCDVTRSSEAAPVQPAERETASEETEQPLQPTADEPVQCLEVYTAVGQDSITNKRRFQEEEGVKEAFAEDDPAMDPIVEEQKTGRWCVL